RRRGVVTLVALYARLRGQPVYLGGAEYLGRRTAAFRPLDDGGWVVATAPLCIEEAIELADGREPPRHRRGREATLAERSEIAAQVLGRGASDAASGFVELCGEVGEVAGIRGERVLGSPALGGAHVEEQLDHRLVRICG